MSRHSVIIHKNEKLGLEITPRTRRFVSADQRGGRGSAESSSFVPPDDAAGWAENIRAVVKSGRRTE